MCSFSEKELVDFHQFLEQSFPFDDRTKVKKGVGTVDKQVGDIWVVSREIHIDADGNAIPLSESTYAWQPISGPAIEMMVKGNVVGRINLECEVHLPLDSTHLSDLLLSMQGVFILLTCNEVGFIVQ